MCCYIFFPAFLTCIYFPLLMQDAEVEAKAAEEKKRKDSMKVKRETKKKVVLIDMKRAQNAGIALARIRFPYDEIRRKIETMDNTGFTTDQLRSLEEYLPTPMEEDTVGGYTGDPALLGQAEQYMKVMTKFPDASKRIKCMIYEQLFKGRVHELKTKISKLENACDDVKLSLRLKKVLKTILKVGNQLNDGEQHGFTLDSLLKLNSAKAFDKKTSVLQYVISLIFRSDNADCLKFPEDLSHVNEASRITLDSIASEKQILRDEFDTNFAVVLEMEEKESGSGGSVVDFFAKVRC